MGAVKKEKSFEYRLSSAQVREFNEIGYVLLPKLFGLKEIEKIRASFDRLLIMAKSLRKTSDLNGARFVVEGDRVDRIVWCGGAEPYLLEVASDHRLLSPAAQLLGSEEMEQLISQAHFKLPADGVGFNWHQDSVHRRYGTDLWTDINGKGSYVQTVLAVDEMTRKNGPLMLVPKSCQRGHMDQEDEKTWTEITSPDKVYTLTMEVGSVLLMHPYTVHGSTPNASKTPRRVLINGYAYPGANKREYPGKGAGRKLKVQA